MVRWLCVLCFVPVAHLLSAPTTEDKYADLQKVVAETHEASLKIREDALRNFLNTPKRFPGNKWGENLWCLTALYLNERVDEANEILYDQAKTFVDATDAPGYVAPHEKHVGPEWPFGFFSIGEYYRTYALFNSRSPHFPGRLEPRVEKVMKEVFWRFVKRGSVVEEASPEYYLSYYGTENHDLVQRPYFYMMNSILKDDPEFNQRKYNDGKTAQEHYQAYNRFFQERPRVRARRGHWIEAGSDTYAKYAVPYILDLAELAPDPRVRKRYRMTLDLYFIDNALLSVRGRRGGARSRASAEKYGGNGLEAILKVLLGIEGFEFGSSHSKRFETSTYQLPDAAIALHKLEFPVVDPFVISHRILGEVDETRDTQSKVEHLNHNHPDPKNVNYAYRTPYYLLGGFLFDPSHKYLGISRQNRWVGMLFDNPDIIMAGSGKSASKENEVSAIFPYYEVPKVNGKRKGRPQNSIWSFQHEDVMVVQRIPPQKGMGSYNTNIVGMKFYGDRLSKVEEDGWVFATDGKTFAAVKLLDGEPEWRKTEKPRTILDPKGFKPVDATRYLLHSGDINAYGSFEEFRSAIRANKLEVSDSTVRYTPGPDRPLITVNKFQPQAYKSFQEPTVDGKKIDLQPEWIYRSPYINGHRNDDLVMITVGPIKEVYDLGDTNIESTVPGRILVSDANVLVQEPQLEDGKVIYPVTIPKAGKYSIWVRVKGKKAETKVTVAGVAGRLRGIDGNMQFVPLVDAKGKNLQFERSPETKQLALELDHTGYEFADLLLTYTPETKTKGKAK